MTMQIKSIILYGKNQKIRELDFKLGSVNIITGQSRTGKSAIIDIVDYCMGRSKFQVFEGVNRDVVIWYAVRLQINHEQVFIAKPAPKDGAVSQSTAYIRMGSEIPTPALSELVANTNDEALTSELSAYLRISPNLHIPGEKETRPPLQATIDHTKYFLFQEQGEIANRSLLFHRQSEPFMPQAIKDTLPYLLGAVPEDELTLSQEERDLKRQLRLLEKQNYERSSIIGVENAQGLQLIEEAKTVGLIAIDEDISTQEKLRTSLENARNWKPTRIISAQTPNEESQLNLNNQIESAMQEYREVHERLVQVKFFETQTSTFSGAALEQARRLKSIEIFPTNVSEKTGTCPLCGSESSITPQMKNIRKNLEDLTDDLKMVEAQAPRLREHAEQLEKELIVKRNKVAQLQRALQSLAGTEDAFQAQQDLNARIAMVIGRISLYLESVEEIKPESSNNQKIESLKKRLSILADLLDGEESAQKLDSALNRIGVTMTKFAEALDLEFAGSPYRFDLKNLTVVADTKRAIPMDRMGSGENWLGCHLIVLLALHKHFILNQRPVPGFIIIDQPSQVYFPSNITYKSLDGSSESLTKTDADINAVSRMFKLLKSVCEELTPYFQIIVTEHANLPEQWFQEMLVEAPWRDGNALIPKDWLP